MATYRGAAFEALADSTRRRVFELVAARPRSVAEIAAELPVSRPAVSQHLKVLLDAGLVTVTPAGTRRLYALDPAGLAPLRAYLEQFWARSLADFKAAVERPAGSLSETSLSETSLSETSLSETSLSEKEQS